MKKTSFYFSTAQKKEDGIVNGTGYRNTSLRLNVDHRINDNIKIGISTNYINSSADRGLTGNDNNGVTYSISLSSTPNFIELHPNEFGAYPANPFGASNVLQTIALMRNNENVNRFATGFNVEAILLKGENQLQNSLEEEVLIFITSLLLLCFQENCSSRRLIKALLSRALPKA
ncbi:MAG: hypothetical protein WDO71_22285 [Bacteroidota bacterium]